MPGHRAIDRREDLVQRAAQLLDELFRRDAVARLLLVQRLVDVLAVVDPDLPVEAGGPGVADRLQLDDDDGGPVAGPRIADDYPVLAVGCARMDEPGRQCGLGTTVCTIRGTSWSRWATQSASAAGSPPRLRSYSTTSWR